MFKFSSQCDPYADSLICSFHFSFLDRSVYRASDRQADRGRKRIAFARAAAWQARLCQGYGVASKTMDDGDLETFKGENGCIPHVCRSRTSNNDRFAREPMRGSSDRSRQYKLRLSC